MSNDLPTYDIKSASLSLVAFLLKTTDLQQLADDLDRRLGANPGFFEHDPVVIDLSGLDDPHAPLDLTAVCDLLRQQRLQPVAVRHAQPHHLTSAHAAGLFEAQDVQVQANTRTETVVQEVIREVEVVREVPVANGAMVVDRPLRSGQHVYARGRDLIVLAMVNPGAEVMADGHIHVYAPLRGKAIAGARGDINARIFTSCLEAELIAIAGTYRTSETPLPAEVAGKPAHIGLQGEKLVIQGL